jgi:hypothetical protein
MSCVVAMHWCNLQKQPTLHTGAGPCSSATADLLSIRHVEWNDVYSAAKVPDNLAGVARGCQLNTPVRFARTMCHSCNHLPSCIQLLTCARHTTGR